MVLAVQLGNGLVALVEHDQEVLREVVEQRVRRLARRPAVDRARVVLDARAEADLLHHLEVVLGAHPQALGLEQLALLLEVGQPLLQLGLDADDRLLHPLLAGHVVGGREQDEVVVGADLLARHRVDHQHLLDLVAEQLDAQRRLVVGRVDLDRVAPDPELAPGEVHVVALVLHVDELAEERPLVDLLAGAQDDEVVLVLLGRAEAVDAGDRGDDDDVPPGQQRRGGRVAEALDLVVHRRVLLDVRVARGHVRLGLVVVVVGDEVLDPVVREEGAELAGQLGGQATCSGR